MFYLVVLMGDSDEDDGFVVKLKRKVVKMRNLVEDLMGKEMVVCDGGI